MDIEIKTLKTTIYNIPECQAARTFQRFSSYLSSPTIQYLLLFYTIYTIVKVI